MKKIIVSVTSDLSTDNRVDRTCKALLEYGFEVILVGRIKSDSIDLENRKYPCKRFKLFFQKGAFFYMEYNLRLFIFLLFKKKDVLYSNDLDTLLANYFAKKFSRNTKLIYDSHELFTEAPELINRKRIRYFWLLIERFIFPKLNFIITVNESIASIYKALYGKDISVIRNVPFYYERISALQKEKIGIPKNNFTAIIQGSGLNIERGIEEAILSMHLLKNVSLLIVGNGDVIPLAKKMVLLEGLENSVFFFEKRPYTELMGFTELADVGLAIDKPKSKNYELALPNKLFDYMHAGTPILSSELIEITSLIQKYQIGISITTVTPQAIAAGINYLKEHPKEIKRMSENCFEAAKIENWENEKQKLTSLLDRMYS
jgi:glycosyltransferase involved in cell wall biosynthesis